MKKKSKQTRNKLLAVGLAGAIAAQTLIPVITQAWTPRSVLEIQNSIVAQNQHYGETLHGYRVLHGDTVWGFSQATGHSVADISKTYGIKNPARIYAGQVLRRVSDIKLDAPEDGYYLVRYGDTLYNISKAFGTTVDQLVKWNNIANRNLIYVGDKLQVKAGGTANTDVEQPDVEKPTVELPADSSPENEAPENSDVPVTPDTPVDPDEPVIPEIPQPDPVVPELPEEPTQDDENYDPPIEVKERTENEAIPYETIYIEIDSLPDGEERVIQEGVDGLRELVWEQTIKGGVLTNESYAGDKVITEPINKIVEIGTYVAPEITIDYRTEDVKTPFDTHYIEDESLAEGEEIVMQEGVEGTMEIVYELTYQDGKLINDKFHSRKELIAPIEKVVLIGTRVEQVVTTERLTELNQTPYETIEHFNKDLDKGERVVSQEGRLGSEEVEYEVTYHDGVETSRRVVNVTIIDEAVNEIVQIGTKEREPVITHETTTSEEVIAFNTRYVENPELEEGVERVVQEGVPGLYTYTYVKTFYDGVFVNETSSAKTTSLPVEQIIEVGTYVAPAEDDKYDLLTDEDFNQWGRYIGDEEYVIIPNTINGEAVVSYNDMFSQKNHVKGVRSDNLSVSSTVKMFGWNEGDNLDISGLNTDNVRDMSQMLTNIKLDTLNLGDMNFSNVTSMSMFLSMADIGEIVVGNIDTSNVENMAALFFNHTKVHTSLVDKLNVDSVRDFTSMFSYVQGDTLDISHWNISKEADISNMFYGSNIGKIIVKDQETANRIQAQFDKDIKDVLDAGGQYYFDPLNIVVK